MERWRISSCVGTGVLVLSAFLPWLTVSLNLSDVERGTQQYSILGVSTKILSLSASGSAYVSTPYFVGLFDVNYFTLSATLLLAAIILNSISGVFGKLRFQLFAAVVAFTAALYWLDDVIFLNDYLYLHNYLSPGMCYIDSKWVRCVSAKAGIGAYLVLAVGLTLLGSWLMSNQKPSAAQG